MTSRNRIRSRAWFFTWDNPENGLGHRLSSIFEGVEYVAQLERGDGGLIHLQGVIRFTNPREGVGEWFSLCHWERCRNWRQAVKYCTKVDTRIDGPWTNVKGLRWRQTIRDPLQGKDLYPWQEEILHLIEAEPDDRTVHWYWEPAGCAGKTSLAKSICIRYGKKAIYVGGANRDILYGVACALEEEDLHVAIFGLSRQDASYMSYKSLEQIKDGIFFAGKYDSKMMLFNAPHVVVFANFPPDLGQLSNDRWNIVRIGN